MERKAAKTALGVAIALAISIGAQTLSAQTTENDLRQAIESKSAELQKIQEERANVERVLEETTQVKNTLSREIKIVDYQIKQLDLSVKANRLNLEKLTLEMETIAEDIPRLEEMIANKRETVGKLLTALQERERENLLVILLRSENLAAGVSEIQSITTMNFNLAASAEALEELKGTLAEKYDETKSLRATREREQVTLASRQTIIQDQKSAKQSILAQTKNQENVYQEELDKLEKLQAEISKEIDDIESVLRQNIDPNMLPTPRPGVLEWPVPEGRLTQSYGRTAFAIRTYASQWHNGIDIGRFIGAEVIAAEKGTVINTGNQDAYRGCKGGAYGKFIVIKHENGLTTLYGHLSKTLVSIGQKVERGETIGYMGRTGWATGPHLRFTVFASQTLTPARAGAPEGTKPSRVCGPMPVGGDLSPLQYLDI